MNTEWQKIDDTFVIREWITTLRPFARVRTSDEYDVIIAVPRVLRDVTVQVGDITMPNRLEKTIRGDNGEMGDLRLFSAYKFVWLVRINGM